MRGFNIREIIRSTPAKSWETLWGSVDAPSQGLGFTSQTPDKAQSSKCPDPFHITVDGGNLASLVPKVPGIYSVLGFLGGARFDP